MSSNDPEVDQRRRESGAGYREVFDAMDVAFLASGGEMGALMRAHDWAATPLGPVETWPQSLRSSLSVCLNSSIPSAIYWGADSRLLYNDAYSEILVDRHPWALGQRFEEVWPEAWPVLGPQLAMVVATGRGFATERFQLFLKRRGALQETHWFYSFAPIRGEAGDVLGIFLSSLDITDSVLAEKRRMFRLALEERLLGLEDPLAMAEAATALLAEHLRVAQVGFAQVDDDQTHIVVARDWTDGRIPSVVGRWRMDDFGAEFIREMKAGETIAIADVALDARTRAPDVLAAYDRIGTRAILDVPLIRDGRMRATLFVHHPEPRAWGAEEVALVEETCARLWSAVERARPRRHCARTRRGRPSC